MDAMIRPDIEHAPLEIDSGTFRPSYRAIVAALLAGSWLLVFYLTVITLAQDWSHATAQLAEDRWFIAVIALGFSIQAGLFIYLRQLQARMASGGVVASTGTSTAAMLACCAHHLAEVLPIIGLSGAAIFLNAYKAQLLWLAIAMNVAGVVYLLHKVRQHRNMVCQLHEGAVHHGS
jgi:hypothetical protein